eukprot:scaffold2858_cov245-Ochromonas_danica.AAC.8
MAKGGFVTWLDSPDKFGRVDLFDSGGTAPVSDVDFSITHRNLLNKFFFFFALSATIRALG